MTHFAQTYLGRLRQRIGHDLVIMPGVQIVIQHADGGVLLQRRTDTGRWELPSGACEPGESFVRTAAVELAEETGIRMPPERFVPFATCSDPTAMIIHYPNGDVVQAYALCLLVRLHEGERPTLDGIDGEAWDHRWSTTLSIPSPAMASSVAVLDLFRRYERTGQFQAG